MSKTWKSILSLMLVAVFLLQLLPTPSYAAGIAGKPKDETSEDAPVKSESGGDTTESYVIGEVEGLREEAIKHFRMSDGSYILVEYDEPVHYQNNDGEWEEIDNTLDKVGTEYVSENGPIRKAFSVNLTNGELFDISYKDYKLGMTLMEKTPSNEAVADLSDNQANATNLSDSETPDESDAEAEPDTEEFLSDNDSVHDFESESIQELAPSPKEQERMITSSDEANLFRPETSKQVRYIAVESKEVTAKIENPTQSRKAPKKAKPISVDEAVAPMKNIASVCYENVLDNTDLSYQSHGNSIKESIIINEKQDQYSYYFALDLNNLLPVLQEDGSVALLNSNNESIFTIPAPWMQDANNVISDQAQYSLEESDGKWILAVSADADWVNADDRAFPVSIDPTVIQNGQSYVSTGFIFKGSVLSPGGSTTLLCGYSNISSMGSCEVCVQVNSLPTIPNNCVPVSAWISLAQGGIYNSSDTSFSNGNAQPGFLTVVAHPTYHVIENLSSLTSLGLYTSGVKTSVTLDYKKLDVSTNGIFVNWDITSEAMRWLTNNSVDCGIVLRAPYGETTENKIAVLAGSGSAQSSVRPYFVVAYRNTVGLENYYTYQNASAGRAGNVYISDFTTQLTAVHQDLTFASEATPFSLSHVYTSENSGQQFTKKDSTYSNGIHTVDFSSMKIGSGWKLSAQQTIVPVTISGTSYWIYNDADGTEHFFAPIDNSNTKFRDEDGLNLELERDSISTVTYTITDKDKNRLVFYNGYLISQIDNVGNAIHFAYNNNYSSTNTWKPTANSTTNKLVQIVSVPNGKSSTTICSFTYSSGELSYITDYAGRRLYFDYATENGQRNLKSIQHTDSTYAQYEYDNASGRIATLYDQESKTGLGITQRYVLGRWATNQVSEFSANSINGTRTVGNAFHAYRNSPQMTSYRFYGPDHTSDTQDDTVSFYVLDYWGRTICQYNSDYLKWAVLGASSSVYTQNSGIDKKNNRVTGAASLGMEPLNLLNNSGVEVTDSSWGAGTVPSTGTAGRSNAKTRTGFGALRLSNTSTSATSTVSIRQSVTLEAGKAYTFTGYINTSGLTNFASANSGAYLAFTNSNSSVLAKSDIINYKSVENVNNSTTNYDLGWEEVSVTYTPTLAGTYYVAFLQKGASGASFCDDLQLEKDRSRIYHDYDSTASSVNLLKWDANSWSGSGYSFVEEYDKLKDISAEVQGDITQQRRLSTNIGINKPARNLSFVLSGWAKAQSVASAVPEPNPACWRYYGLVATLNYTDGTTEVHYVSFNKDNTDWQYTSGIVVPEPENINKIVDTITVSCAYDYNSNTARFNNISLIREPVQIYSYDSNGNAVKSSNTYGEENGEYNSSNLLTSYTSASGAEHTLGYSGQLLTSDACNGLTTTYSYNSTGSVEDTTTSASSNNYLKTANTYSSDGHFLKSSTDVNGNTTNYSNNLSSRNLYYTRFPNNAYQFCYYSSADRLTRTNHTGGSAIDYQYQNGRLSNLQRESRDNNSNFAYQQYVMAYDDFGNTTQVAVRSSQDLNTFSDPIVLASYEYENSVNNTNVNNGRLSKLTYANGNTVRYTYDMFDRVKTATYNDGTVYHYHYDANGRISNQSATTLLGSVYHSYSFQYDSLGRLSHSRQYNGTTLAMTTSHIYDAADRLVNQYWQFGNNDSYGQTFEYGDSSHGTDVLHSMTISTPGSGDHTITYDYNNLHQLTQKKQTVGGSNLIRSYSYLENPQNSNQKTMQIGETKYTRGSTTLGYTYQYDSMGNITTVHKSGSPNADYQTYSYDSLGQMVSATDADLGKEYTYTYDTAGNILTSLEHPTGNGSDYAKTYHYDNDSWKDLLTSVTVNGTTRTISYPTSSSGKVTSGTPLSWYNGSNYTFSWIKGTRLASAKKGSSTTAYYAYDMAGLRTSKTIGLVVYNYTTLSGKVMRVSWGSSWMDFTYDESGQPYALIYKSSSNATPAMYYYLLNQQGDVMALMDSNGSIVANYQYDPWGAVTVLNPNGTTNTSSTFIGNMNPLRYRGYYYDKETGFYYLQSRYYDPAIGRFISADTYASTGTGALGYNMFSYCCNNPVNCIDPSGHAFMFITAAIGAVIGAIWGGIKAYRTGNSIWLGALKGAAIGSLAGLGLGAFTAVSLAGGVMASTAAVFEGFTTLASAISAGGISAGGSLILKNISNAFSPIARGQGFSTFSQLKSFLGSPGEGKQWHHIVEQCQISKSGFAPEMIHNTNNIYAISADVHKLISGYYSSIQPYTNGEIVRNWLAGQSFQAQLKFGMDVIRMFM